MNVPDDHGGYANLTNWFEIAGPLDKHDRRKWRAWQVTVFAVVVAAVVTSTIAGVLLVVMRRRLRTQESQSKSLIQQEDADAAGDRSYGT